MYDRKNKTLLCPLSQDFCRDIWLVGKFKIYHKQNESNDPFCRFPVVQIVARVDAQCTNTEPTITTPKSKRTLLGCDGG